MKSLFSFILLLFISCGTQSNKNDDPPQPVVHMFGNSLFAWNDHGVQRALNEYGLDNIADHSVIGETAFQIQMQYLGAINSGQKVDVAIIDAGANDMFLHADSCYGYSRVTYECKKIIETAILKTQYDMITLMKAEGTKKIAVVTPYHLIGVASGFNVVGDYAHTLYPLICYDNTETECVIVDPRQAFDDGKDLFFIDGIHPSVKGDHVLARLILNAFNL